MKEIFENIQYIFLIILLKLNMKEIRYININLKFFRIRINRY